MTGTAKNNLETAAETTEAVVIVTESVIIECVTPITEEEAMKKIVVNEDSEAATLEPISEVIADETAVITKPTPGLFDYYFGWLLGRGTEKVAEEVKSTEAAKPAAPHA